MAFTKALTVISTLLLLSLVHGQAPRPNARGSNRGNQRRSLDAVQPGSREEQNRASTPCNPFFRSLNGVCTNRVFRLWGSTNRAQSSLFFTHSSKYPTGADLPSARFVSNALNQQSMDNFNDRGLNELVTFFGQFIDHTFVATPLSDEEMPIEIPHDDPIFANFTNGELEFRRSSRARIDIFGLYGSGNFALSRRIPGVANSQPGLAGPGVSNVPRNLRPVKATPPTSIEGLDGKPATEQSNGPIGSPIGSEIGASTRQRRPAVGNRPDPRAPSDNEGPNSAPSPRNIAFFLQNERPINALSSALDLSSVYGNDAVRANALRAPGGKLLVDGNNLLPLNFFGLNNAPVSSPAFFLAGDIRANEHPVLTSLHTVFVREHNSIVDEIKSAFPTLSDELTFLLARKINGAQFQKIVFEEFYPAITGRFLPAYRGFRFYRNPAIIDVFSTAAFRVGHTMVGNQLSRAGPGNTPLSPIPFTQMFFRTAAQFQAFGDFENFLRGAMQTNAQEIDLEVHNALRNFLFTGIPEEGGGFDLVSLNLQRGRDHALPTYNAIRQRLGIPRATSFADISSNPNVQSALSSVYGSVDRVEAWIGLIGEDHVPGSSLGRVMLALWERQFTNLRDGDFFFFRNNLFPPFLTARLPRINKIFTTPQLLRDILVRNTDIDFADVPPQVFFKR